MRNLLIAAAAMGICGAGLAGPLDTERVAADAVWLIHVDVEALTASTIGKAVLENGDRFDIDFDELDEIKEELGLDLRTDLLGITAYGSSEDFEEEGVIVAVTNDRADEALQRLINHKDVRVRTIDLDGYTVYALDEGDHYLHVGRADRRDRRIVVVSSDKHALQAALKVIEGRAPSLSVGKSPFLASRPGKSSIIFAAVGKVGALHGIEPASRILQLSDGLTVDIGEAEGEVRAEATVSATTRENAENISRVLDGAIGLALLAAQDNPQLGRLTDLARSLSVTTRDQKIAIALHCPARLLLDDLEKLQDIDDQDDQDDQDDHDRDD